MCFSPEMDAITGTIVTAIGIDALAHVRSPRYLPLAALPALFGIHQLVETLVWLHLQGHLGDATGRVATDIYAWIAFAVVPIVVPFALLCANVVRWRVVAYTGMLCGLVAGGLGLWGATRAPITSCIVGHHISYSGHVPASHLMLVLYIAGTCVPTVLTNERLLQAFGIANLAAVLALIWISRSGLTSLWCVWAAITSVVIDVFVRSRPSAQDLPPD